MSIKITYFVHGTTVDNEDRISSGWSDPELSELGVKQGKELREKTKDHKFDMVFCSDLKRASNSAELSFGGTYEIIEDRRAAVVKALSKAKEGDVIVLLAKGAEPFQKIQGNLVQYESDIELARKWSNDK